MKKMTVLISLLLLSTNSIARRDGGGYRARKNLPLFQMNASELGAEFAQASKRIKTIKEIIKERVLLKEPDFKDIDLGTRIMYGEKNFEQAEIYARRGVHVARRLKNEPKLGKFLSLLGFVQMHAKKTQDSFDNLIAAKSLRYAMDKESEYFLLQNLAIMYSACLSERVTLVGLSKDSCAEESMEVNIALYNEYQHEGSYDVLSKYFSERVKALEDEYAQLDPNSDTAEIVSFQLKAVKSNLETIEKQALYYKANPQKK